MRSEFTSSLNWASSSLASLFDEIGPWTRFYSLSARYQRTRGTAKQFLKVGQLRLCQAIKPCSPIKLCNENQTVPFARNRPSLADLQPCVVASKSSEHIPHVALSYDLDGLEPQAAGISDPPRAKTIHKPLVTRNFDQMVPSLSTKPFDFLIKTQK